MNKSEIQGILFNLFSDYSPNTTCKMLITAAKEAAEFETDIDVAAARKEFARQLEVLIESNELRVIDLLVQAMDYPLPKVEEEIQDLHIIEECDDRTETRVFRRSTMFQLTECSPIPATANTSQPISSPRGKLIAFDRKKTLFDEVINVQDHEVQYVSDDDPTDPNINLSRLGGQ